MPQQIEIMEENREILKILGLEGKRIQRIAIDFIPGEYPIATISMLLEDKIIKEICESISIPKEQKSCQE